MELTLTVARLGGLDDDWGPSLVSEPLSFQDFPEPGSEATIEISASVPEWLIIHERNRRAVGEAILTRAFGGLGAQDLDERIAEIVARRPRPDFPSKGTYICVSVSRRTVVDGTLESPSSKFLISQSLYKIGHDFGCRVREAIDVLVARDGVALNTRDFDLLLNDAVFMTAPGYEPAGVIRLAASASASVTKSLEKQITASGELGALATHDPKVWRETTATRQGSHFFLTALDTKLDPWTRFLVAFVGIEVMTDALYHTIRSSFSERLRLQRSGGELLEVLPHEHLLPLGKRPPLRQRFAVVASEVFQETAREQMGHFNSVYDARNDVAHGDSRVDTDVPTHEAVDLLCLLMHAAFVRAAEGHSSAS